VDAGLLETVKKTRAERRCEVRGKGPVSGQRRTKGATLLSDAGTAKNRLFSISGKMTGVCPHVLSGKSFRFGYLRDIDYGNIRNSNTFSSDYLE